MHHALLLSLLLVLLWLASLAGCAKWQPKAISTSNMGFICMRGREVYCEKGNPECDALREAVAEVDRAVPKLLRYKGEVDRSTLVAMSNQPLADILVMLRGEGVHPDRATYSKLPIAFTLVSPGMLTACIHTTPIVLVWPHNGLNEVEWRQVVLHEVMHSLGAAHTNEDCPFSTVMHPALSEERRVGLSKADRNWLRAVYGG